MVVQIMCIINSYNRNNIIFIVVYAARDGIYVIIFFCLVRRKKMVHNGNSNLLTYKLQKTFALLV